MLLADALALLLEAARTYEPNGEHGGRRPVLFGHELCATCALTGGRPSEVLGLEVSDVSFDRQTVTFRPNRWRRLKTEGSARVVPLWAQLEEILRPYVFGERSPSHLLFPSYVKSKHNPEGAEAMLTDFRKTLDAIGAQIGYQPRELNLYVFRHSYSAARLQTLNHGAPVSPFTVARELGHGGDALVRKIYGHLGTVRHRSDAWSSGLSNTPLLWGIGWRGSV